MLTLESGTVIYFGRHEYSQPISIPAPFSGVHQTNSQLKTLRYEILGCTPAEKFVIELRPTGLTSITNFSAGVQASNFVHLFIPLISKYVLVELLFFRCTMPVSKSTYHFCREARLSTFTTKSQVHQPSIGS